MLLSVVLRNDGEINVVDHARPVKTFRDPLPRAITNRLYIEMQGPIID